MGYQAIDPLFALSVILFQIGNRYLKINITKAQEEILMHPITQMLLYFTIIYYPIRNFYVAAFIAMTSYILYAILLNENHPYNIFPEKWLSEKINNRPIFSYKDIYKNNIELIHL